MGVEGDTREAVWPNWLVIGFVGPVLFYAVPYTFESHIACLCPYIDAPFMRPLDWLEIGLTVGLFQGLIFAVLGFAIGCSIFRIKQPPKTIWHAAAWTSRLRSYVVPASTLWPRFYLTIVPP